MFDNQKPQTSQKKPSAPVPPDSSPGYQPPAIPQLPREHIKETGRITSAGWLAMTLFLVIAGVGSGYYVYITFFAPEKKAGPVVADTNSAVEPAAEEKVTGKTFNILGAPIAYAHEFAAFSETAVNVSPSIPAIAKAADLSDITNINDEVFSNLSPAAKQQLAKNDFVVMPGYHDEFFSIYENNRYNYTPSFITSDSLLHNYHLAFDYLLRTIETNKLKQKMTDLTYKLTLATKVQYDELKGTEWENAAKRNVAFFTIANKLIYPAAEPADYVAADVEAELELIENHTEIAPSPVMNIGATDPKEFNNEDYSQYIPRGHYTRSEDLKAYFKSMMYLGRLTFRQKSADETKSAILITQALTADQSLRDLWESVYQPTSFFVGVADDLTYNDYSKALADIYGASFQTQDVLDGQKLTAATTALANLAGPKINSMPIFDARFQPDREKEIKGFRFMGQRYTLDADIFQRLVYREVGDKEHQCDSDPTTWIPQKSRRLPSALDVAAAFGSNQANQIQVKKGEGDYACYNENLDKMQQYVDQVDNKTWVQNLYWGWLYSMRPLLAQKGTGYPAFMQNPAWQHKDLNTFLGNWTELKHDTILYAKQVYAEMGGGGDLPKQKDDRGYVEPNTHVYARLAALTKMTKEGLQLRTLIDANQADLLDRLETLALKLKEISEKELNNQSLSDEDYEFIRGYGGSLEHMWLDAVKDLGIETTSQLSEEPAALVADVASDPSGSVLEEGTGRLSTIYVLVPVEGKLRLARGSVYSYYEFTWPMSDRLSDEKWRTMLNENKQPALPEWTGTFMAE